MAKASTRFMYRRRKFNGKTYGVEARTDTKRGATAIAKLARDKGFSARITKDKSYNEYVVWTHPVV